MKRKVFAGSAVAAALLFQLTAVGFPAYAAEYDAVQKEEFVSSFSDAERLSKLPSIWLTMDCL